MTKKRKPHEDIRFSARKVSGIGVLSAVLAVLSLILFPAAVCLSCAAAGRAGTQVGALGMLALIIGLIAGALGVSESHNDEVNHTVPRFGARVGFLSVIIWMVILIIGLRA